MMTRHNPEGAPTPQVSPQTPTFRSGAVARAAGMPVATLRIWEQRYRAVQPGAATSGHRLYTAADVERVILLRRLTEQGHAISLLAPLDLPQLRAIARAHPEATLNDFTQASPPSQALKLVVVGPALANRLKRLIDRQRGRLSVRWVGVFDSLADAALAASSASELGVDLLLWQSAGLQPDAGHQLRLAQEAWQASATAVVYRYSSAAGRAALSSTGVALLQESADEGLLSEWFMGLGRKAMAPTRQSREVFDPRQLSAQGVAEPEASPPRFTDEALSEFAALSSTVACECPSHLAQLLLQISNFETYSGDCANRSVADAQLHAYLQQVAGSARKLFETALEKVAQAEGLPLPVKP